MHDPKDHQESQASGKKYIPTLDGWRAIAIFPVLLSHYAPAIAFLPRGTVGIGGFGVAIFFALSGLLIGTMLLREADSGGVGLGSFYLRRSFRILPVAWTFLIAVALLRHIAALTASDTDLWASAFFLRNYAGAILGTTQHFWSLAIEEHFYLVFPVFLAFFGKRATRSLCVAVAVGVWLWRWYHEVQPDWNFLTGFFRTDYRIDALFDGVLVATLLHDPRTRVRLERAGPWLLLVVPGLLALLAHRIPSASADRAVTSLAIPFVLASGILFPGTWWARALEWAWLRWIGRLSYSLYIWQGMFTGNLLHMLWGERLWPLNLAALAATSIASFYLLERPMIHVGRRLLQRPEARLK